jgi:flagellar basal-body rod modification protein FlgD
VTTPVTEATGGLLSQIAGSSTGATSANSMDKDTFLQLLVAQLRYQDPMNPTDSTQFLAQSAQFTALEKMEEVAEQTAQAVAAQMAFGASSLVGRKVTYTDAAGETHTGTVDAVRFTAEGPTLDVGGTDVALGNVQTVAEGRRTSSTGTSVTDQGSGSEPNS